MKKVALIAGIFAFVFFGTVALSPVLAQSSTTTVQDDPPKKDDVKKEKTAEYKKGDCSKPCEASKSCCGSKTAKPDCPPTAPKSAKADATEAKEKKTDGDKK
ncbi:MAG: hypothetical protein JXA03_15820 [Bacteroidales bacterium]|nr:hypothetical protein [Bacteroidales bacterium]